MCVPMLIREDLLHGLADGEATQAAEIHWEHALFRVDGMERTRGMLGGGVQPLAIISGEEMKCGGSGTILED